MKLLTGIATALALALAGPAVHAKITRLEITSKQPYGSFAAGDYVRWDGRIMGELAPDASVIPGLDKAARNASGMVEYSGRIILFIPSGSPGNGALLVDVPNRGHAYANALYNSPRGTPSQSGNTDPNTGFLEDHGFSAAEVYWELGQGADLPSFTGADGKQRFVEGVGFAIVRDAADFLAHAPADSAGTANPFAGKINRVLATGKSQDGRFLKTFLLNGFNMLDGRRVFDGMHVFVSAAGLLPILQTGTGPRSSGDVAPSFADPDYPGVNDGLLTIADIIAKVQARGEIPPKMLLINSTSDYLSIRASLGRTGASGTADLPLPDNVRMYDVAGGSHATVLEAKECELPPNRLDWAPVARATLLRLDGWVAGNAPPPRTTLMPLQSAKGDPNVLQAPSYLPDAVIQVPQRDADGNPIGGVRMPDVAVPLGANALQQVPHSFTCSLVGAYQPFGKEKLASLYKNNGDYVNRVRVAARQAEDAGFLLPEDGAVIVNAAAGSLPFGSTAPDGSPR